MADPIDTKALPTSAFVTAAEFKSMFPQATQRRDEDIEAAIVAVTTAYMQEWLGAEFMAWWKSLSAGTIKSYLRNGSVDWAGFSRIVGELAYCFLLYMQAQVVRMGAVIKQGQYSRSSTEAEIATEVSRRKAMAVLNMRNFRDNVWPAAPWYESWRQSWEACGGADVRLPKHLTNDTDLLGEWRP